MLIKAGPVRPPTPKKMVSRAGGFRKAGIPERTRRMGKADVVS
jgi:hypothetical protein